MFSIYYFYFSFFTYNDNQSVCYLIEITFLNILFRTIRKLRTEGITRTFNASFSHVYDLYFDWKYNLDTIKWISHEDLIEENSIAKYSGHYQGTNAYLVKLILKRLKLSKKETFVDIGSGKGRALLIAQKYGFKSIKGIELSEQLCEIAHKNIQLFTSKTKSPSNISIYNIDATTYKFQPEDSIIFMYNPFNGIIFEKVIKNLSQSLQDHPRKMTIIYSHPTEAEVLESHITYSSKKRYTWNEDYIIYNIN